jgi:hypothetical protein
MSLEMLIVNQLLVDMGSASKCLTDTDTANIPGECPFHYSNFNSNIEKIT